MLTYFSWWYGQGLINFWQAILVMSEKIYSFFSVRILIRTLFDPWKRDAYGVQNASLQTRLRVMLDNLISRFIGFIIRLITILLGLATTLIFFLFLFLVLMVWMVLPIVVIFLVVNGIKGVVNG